MLSKCDRFATCCIRRTCRTRGCRYSSSLPTLPSVVPVYHSKEGSSCRCLSLDRTLSGTRLRPRLPSRSVPSAACAWSEKLKQPRDIRYRGIRGTTHISTTRHAASTKVYPRRQNGFTPPPYRAYSVLPVQRRLLANHGVVQHARYWCN